MSVVINTNFAATYAANNLSAASSMMQKSLNRLSSGTKIVDPADDAGGLAVSMRLSSAARRSGAAITNINNSISFLQTQDGTLKVTGKVLDRISELKTLYADPTKNPEDLANYDAEFNQLQDELTSLAAEKFNAIALFGTDGDLSTAVSEDGATTVSVSRSDLGGTSDGVGALTDSTVTTLEDIPLSDMALPMTNSSNSSSEAVGSLLY